MKPVRTFFIGDTHFFHSKIIEFENTYRQPYIAKAPA